MIVSGDLSVFSCHEGFKIFYQDKELTKGVGLNVSWFEHQKPKDSTKFQNQTLIWKKNRLRIKKFSSEKNSPSFVFDLSFKSSDILRWHIEINSFSPIKDPKVILMLPSLFKTWIADIHEGHFPQNNQWVNIGFPDPNVRHVGVRTDSFSKNTSFLTILLSTENARHLIENSDASQQARLLCAEFKSLQKTYSFHGNLYIFLKKSQYFNWIHAARKRIFNHRLTQINTD